MYSEINFTKVGINIKMFRAARHIKQMELARLLGISQTHLSNIEKGQRTDQPALAGENG